MSEQQSNRSNNRRSSQQEKLSNINLVDTIADENLDTVQSPLNIDKKVSRESTFHLNINETARARGESIRSNRTNINVSNQSSRAGRATGSQPPQAKSSFEKVPSTIQPRASVAIAAPQSQDIGVDWFHFETRIRKVIMEVVDPLTKKQFMTFEGIDNIKKEVMSVGFKYDDTIGRMDRIIKKNDILDQHEKRIKELENELIVHKNLQRHENTQLLERMETINQKLKVAQNDVNQFAKLEDKIKMVSKSILDMTDEYNVTVTQRLKEVSHGFIRQVQDLDQQYRESQRELQEVLVKLDRIHNYTEKNDLKLTQLHTVVNDLSRTFEDCQLQFATIGQVNVPAQDRVEAKLREYITALEKQIEDFKLLQQEQGTDLKNNLHAYTNNRIEQLIFQNQIDLFERVFSVKAHSFHYTENGNSPNLQSQISFSRKRPSLAEFQLQMQQNFKNWRALQVERGRHDDLQQEISGGNGPNGGDEESLLQRKNRVGSFQFTIHRSESGRGKGPTQPQVEEVPSNQLELQKQLLENGTKTQEGFDEETKKYLQEMQIIDQETLIDGDQAVGRSIVSIKQRASEMNLAQQMRPSILSTTSPQQQLMKQALEGTIEPSDSELEEDDDDSESIRKNRKARLRVNSFLQELTEQRIKDLLNFEIGPLRDIIVQQQKQFEDHIARNDQALAKLSHEPLLQMIGRNRALLDTMKEEVQKLKESDGKASLSHHIQKVEMGLTMCKNDLQQQIYKMKEFDEQLYMKQIELHDKVDYEFIKAKKQEQENVNAVEKVSKELQAFKSDISDLRSVQVTLAQASIILAQLEAISSSLEQQDEVDRKQMSNNQDCYSPSVVHFMGSEFQRQSLIYSRRTLIDNLLLSIITTKQPFMGVIKAYVKDKVGSQQNLMDLFRANLVKELNVINVDFEAKLEAITKEIKRQNEIDSKMLPKEIQRIRNLHNLIDERRTPERTQADFGGILRETNQVIFQQTRNNHLLSTNATAPHLPQRSGGVSQAQQQQYLRGKLNQSMLDQKSSLLTGALPAINSRDDHMLLYGKDDKRFRRINDMVQPQKLMMNVGNIELLPRQKQPLKGPMLLQKAQRNAISVTNPKVSITGGNQAQKQETELGNPVSHSPDLQHVASQNLQFKALEVRQAEMGLPGGQPGTLNFQIPTLVMQHNRSYGSELGREISNLQSQSGLNLSLIQVDKQ